MEIKTIEDLFGDAEQVRSMGYDFHVRSAAIHRAGNALDVRLVVVNQGVAPFSYDWSLELAALDARGSFTRRRPVNWM